MDAGCRSVHVTAPARCRRRVPHKGLCMRILYLVGGGDVIGGGATIRDAAFAEGLVAAGHTVDAISFYGQARLEGESSYCHAFRPLGRHTLRRIFPRLAKFPLALASLVSGARPLDNMTSLAVRGRRADPAGPLAVSLLSGANKLQRREFSRLMEYLAVNSGTVDAVIFSNTMLSGLAEPVRANIGCPIVCLSQGSDRVIEALEEPYRSDARKLVRKNAKLFHLVVSSSRYFAIRANESLALPASRIKVVPPGVDAEAMDNQQERKRSPFTIGYMAPIRKEKGLDILVDAVDGLVKDTAMDIDLWVSGRVEDERYWSRINRRLDNSQLKSRHRIFGAMSSRDRREFMAGLSVFVMPSREPESRATHLLEAMVAGVPVVAPACGIVPEIFQHANGGLLVSSEAPAWMFAQALELLSSMPDTADEMGRAGREGVRNNFSIQSAAAHLAETIESVLPGTARGRGGKSGAR